MTDERPDSDADEDQGGDIAPRPRPGYRTPSAPAFEKARLFAGCLRALIGCVGFFAALLYLPAPRGVPVTPILAGVSILMMVTGTTSVWRAVSEAPHLKIVTRVIMALCALTVVVTVALTMTLGAGALGPLHEQQQQQAQERPPEVRFEVAP